MHEVGTHYDFKTGKITLPGQLKEREEQTHSLYVPGTQFVNKLINGEWKFAISVPVAYA